MGSTLEEMKVRCSFKLGHQQLGTYWMRPDIALGQTFKYELPAVDGVREKMALKIIGIDKILSKNDLFYHVVVEAVELSVLPPGW
jgi:hypothetical protein